MSHEAAAREALHRYLSEAPTQGVLSDRLARAARATLALFDQSLTSPDASTAWADHNLAVLIAEGLADPSLHEAAKVLFLGTRRRLSSALEAEPDDLAPALALARGATTALEDPRLAGDIERVVSALSKAHAGPQLVRAALTMALAAHDSKTKAIKEASAQALLAVHEATERLWAKLPNHPDVLLDRARLALHTSHQLEGEPRQGAMDKAHALLADHEKRFGPTSEARAIRGALLSWRARSGGPGDDIRRDAMTLFEAQAAEGTLSPAQAERLVEAIERAKAMDTESARKLASTLDAIAADNPGPWRKVMTALLAKTGEDTSLIRLWEAALRDDPADEDAAAGLSGRLLENLRAGISAPFDSDILERVLIALPHRKLAKWRFDDLDRVLRHVRESFGVARSASFLRDRVLENRELRKRDATWERALSLFTELGDEAALLEVARLAAKHSKFAKARLLVAERLLSAEASLTELEEAADALRPLLSVRGSEGAAAHKLQQRVLAHPGYREARLHALEAFEERIGVGSDSPFQLRVIHTTPTYALVEAHQHKAPDVYEHRHLRTLIRSQDLPRGIHPLQLRKGDIFEGTLRGQAGDRGKEALRVYWIAHPKRLKLAMGLDAIEARLDKEEKTFGIGSGAPVPLKVFRDAKGKVLLAKIVAKKDGKGGEFPERATLSPEQLPDGMSPDALGKGKRLWALVERSEPNQSDGRRSYSVKGAATAQAPQAPSKKGKARPEESPKAKPADGEESATQPKDKAAPSTEAETTREQGAAEEETTQPQEGEQSP